jgi:16S rRNA (adenine1518-N6/adenine1519-N6)-dimethyltransferase
MVQYEVAKLITAKKNIKDYGILSVLTSFYSETKFCFKISPNVFFPKPKVHSALIHLYFRDLMIKEEQKKLFIKIVKAAFGKRRKILKNSLSNSIFSKIDFTGSGIDLSLRAENLSVQDFEILTNFVLSKTGHSRLPTE